MAGGSIQPQEDASEVGAADKGVGERGSGFLDLGSVIHGSCAGNLVI